jgi:hypothetical protein
MLGRIPTAYRPRSEGRAAYPALRIGESAVECLSETHINHFIRLARLLQSIAGRPRKPANNRFKHPQEDRKYLVFFALLTMPPFSRFGNPIAVFWRKGMA